MTRVILSLLQSARSLTCSEIAQMTGTCPRDAQTALQGLVEDRSVICNGRFYSLSDTLGTGVQG